MVAEQNPLDGQPLFEDAAIRHSFPAPVAEALDVMISEIWESGEETTADEMALVVEELMTWLGRLWIAEYLRAVVEGSSLLDEVLHRDLVDLVARRRKPLTIGQWVSMARRIRLQLSGWPTVVANLAAVDFGVPGDKSPVDRLLHFRNHFSHGSFAATVAEIRAHRQLLHDLLALVPALRTQPVLCKDHDSGVVRSAVVGWPVVQVPSGVSLEAAHPTIVGEEGQACLDLYPLIHVSWEDGGPELTGDVKLKPATLLLEHPALSVWVERYERERQGHVPYEAEISPSALPQSALEVLRARLAQPESELVLLESYPGCGAEGAIAALTEEDPLSLGLSRFAACRQVRVKPGELGQSGVTVARVVLRAIEEALGEPDGTRKASEDNLLESDGPLVSALEALSASGQRVLLGLEGLHHGKAAYRGEGVTVKDVYEALASSAVAVVATMVPGGLDRPFFDHKIAVEVVSEPEAARVGSWVRELAARGALHARVLRALDEAEGPLHLFALCDALESSSEPGVYEPAVERVLWDLRPLLMWRRELVEVEEGISERVRLWRPFMSGLAMHLEEV